MLQQKATQLRQHMRTLNAYKYLQGRTNTTHHTTPGPKPPAPMWAISLDAEITQMLWETTIDAARRITPHYRPARTWESCCHYLAEHATAVLSLDYGQDLAATVDTCLDLIEEAIGTQQHHGERRQTASSICTRLAQESRGGITITPPLLRKWCERGKITARQDSAGRNLYLMSEVLAAASETPTKGQKHPNCHAM